MQKEKTVLVTGSSRGIGKAVIHEFAKNGWNVVAHARTYTEKFSEHIAGLSASYGVAITPLFFDMLDSDAMKKSVLELKKSKISIDSLINNAGIAHGGLFQMTKMSDIVDVFNVNLFAQMELTQLVLRIMVKENASIVNVASAAGIDVRSGNSAYGVSKAALIAWTKVLQAELGSKVRVNAIAPSLIDTDMASLMDEKAALDMIGNSVLKRIAKPEEIVKTIYFLSSDEASSIMGQVLKVGGCI